MKEVQINRFQKDYNKIKFATSHEEVENMFLHIDEKTVTLDATIRLGGKDFEVPQKYIKQCILIKYKPDDLSFVYIYDNKTKTLEKAYPLDKIANSKIKRKEINYT